MSRFLCAVALVFGLVTPSAAAASQDRGIAPPNPTVSVEAAAFGAAPAFHDIALSPDGTRIARIAQHEDRYRIEVWAVDDLSAPTAMYTLSRYNSANWLVWKSDSRLLVSTSQPMSRFGFLLFETRLSVFDPGLSQRVRIAERHRPPDGYPPFQDQLIDLSQDDPDGILIAFNWANPGEPDIQRADLRNGRLTTVRSGGRNIQSWLFEPQSRVFIGMGDTDGAPRIFRATETGGPGALAIRGAGSTFRPVGFDGSPDRLVVASNHEPGPLGIYVYDLVSGSFAETLFKSDRYDADSVIRSADGSRVDGVVWIDDERRVTWLNDEAQALHDRLKSLTGSDELAIVSRTPDGRRLIVMTGEGGRSSGSFLIDLQADTARPLWRISPALDERPVGATTPVSYTAPDGVSIPAYLTLPPGMTAEAARQIPFVVLPHGGPSARDSAEFDFLAQFLASLGYGVLQPNYRGSSGYGEEFRRAGDQQWAGAVLDDVSAGSRWLVDQGLADPERICVVGWSFGGYLALMSAVEHADQYRCVGAIAPVTSIPQIITYSRRFRGGRDAMARMFGIGWGDHARNSRASPLNRVSDIGTPVFMAYGTGDDVVPPVQGYEMYQTMRAAGVDMSVLSIIGADHSISRQPDRTLVLASLEAFLDDHLGSSPAQPD